MKKIEVSMLMPGSEAQQDYYSERGELLISQGVVITSKHMEMLRRRNIFEVYVKLSSEEEELERILSADFGALGKLDIEEQAKRQHKVPPPAKRREPKALSLPEYRTLAKGKDGLSQLLNDSASTSLDNNFVGRTPDKPSGPALAGRASQVAVGERTQQQKRDVSKAYDNALAEVTGILNRLADGHQMNGNEVRDIVKRFVKIFVTDRNILLNISAKKHSGTNHLYHHSLNVCLLAVNIAASMGYSEMQIVEIGMGALLHDLGMFLIPDSIMAKQGRLSEEEWYEVQKHPILALHLLERIRQLPDSVPYMAYQTHERENKTGYPKQRGTHLIHNFAKIVQVADVYEAMSSPRSYRAAHIPYKAMENVIKMTRQGLIAGDYVEAFLRYASLFPV
jgi:HD-GYP domain-containing protein (c-di-GMP phosphodiesterase class II)